MMITGAGLSVGAGISTYRGADGSYTAIEKEVGMPIHTLLTNKMLLKNPELVWKYWLKFALSVADKTPAPAHRAIKAIADQADAFLEVTQNVDGLSVKAGLRDDQLIELHGTARHHHCTKCGRSHHLVLEAEMAIPPKCYVCDPENGALIRPSVVMFEEFISNEHYNKATEFAREANVLIITGTSMQFPYLAQFVALAAQWGAVVLYIDPNAEVDPEWLNDGWGQMYMHSTGDRPLADRIFCIRKTADEILPLLADDFERCLKDLLALHHQGVNTIRV